MLISKKDWERYVNKIAAIDEKAASQMRSYIEVYGIHDSDEIINIAFQLATKYGEAASEAACELYEAIAEAQNMIVPPAEPARTPALEEVEDAIHWATENRSDDDAIPSQVGKLVKKTGTRTMRKNAARDGAKMALIPSGDGCAFCKMLGSRGWEDARSSKSFEAHLHAHCRCEYCVRFNNDLSVDGYDPDALLEEYNSTGGKNAKEKLNLMRRNQRKKEKHFSRGYDVLKDYLEEATPGRGNIDYEQGFLVKGHGKEIATAQTIFDQLGGDIVLKAELPGQKNPDYEWLGRLWDLKSVTTEKAANSAIRSGMKQIKSNPGGIIINLEDASLNMDELRRSIDLRMAWYPNDIADIMIISKGKVSAIYRY